MLKLSKNLRLFKIEERLLIIGSILFVSLLIDYRSNYFWDLDVYQNAINIFNTGGSAYFDLEGLRFVYAPYVLILFAFLGINLSFFFILFYFFSTFLIFRKKLGSQLIKYSLISTAIFYNDFFAKSIATGNLTIFLHFIIIGLACNESRKKIELFLIAIAIAGFIKPYLFSYALLGFVLWPKEKKYVKGLLITAILFFILFLSQLLLTPELFGDFTESLFAQAIGDVDGPGRDVGLAPYWIFASFLDRKYALLFHFVVVILVGKSFFNLGKLINNSLNNEEAKKIFFFFALICITFFNPRMKVYDYWIVMASSAGIIFTLLSQTKLLFRELTFYCFLLIGIFSFSLPIIYKIYIPPLFSYLLCFVYIKTNILLNDSVLNNRLMRTSSRDN